MTGDINPGADYGTDPLRRKMRVWGCGRGGDALQRNGGIGASVDGAPELDECRTAGGEGEPQGGGDNRGRERGAPAMSVGKNW